MRDQVGDTAGHLEPDVTAPVDDSAERLAPRHATTVVDVFVYVVVLNLFVEYLPADASSG